MNILFNNFDREYRIFENRIEEAIKKVLRSGRFILGKECVEFENKLAEFIGSNYSVAVANGTEAITLALKALGIKYGDEVITTSMTAYPTIVGIVEAGAKPVLVDIKPETGLIDEDQIEMLITNKTKAILPVHIYGQSCNMDKLKIIARKHKLSLVEDCAQSIGAKWKDKVTGSFGNCGTFSFYPTKNLGAYGDAGAITTNDKAIYNQLLKLRNYGQSTRYKHDVAGINSRMDEMQAAILLEKLSDLPNRIIRRRQIAKYYSVNLKTVDYVREHEHATHTYHLYVIKTKKRKRLITHLLNKGIETLIHYPLPIHHQKAFSQKITGKLNIAERFTKQILSIPMYPELKDTEVEYIVKTINSFS